MPTSTRVIMLDGTHVPLRAVCTEEGWNGFHVPILTAGELVAYWHACRANDPNGEWTDVPFEDGETLRLPSWESPEDRSEDTTWSPCGTRRVVWAGGPATFENVYRVDGLVWCDYVEED